MADPSTEADSRVDAPAVFTDLRLEEERTPDGRRIFYFSWPAPESQEDEPEPADV